MPPTVYSWPYKTRSIELSGVWTRLWDPLRGIYTTSTTIGGDTCHPRRWHTLGTISPSRRYSCSASSARSQLSREPILPAAAARTRFAPSPTGYLHIGGLRTALFSYLLARRTQGKFILRLEDTDQKRRIADAEPRLLEDLQWAGLDWDYGPSKDGPHAPYRQSDRTVIYQEHAQILLNQESAYRCFCPTRTDGSGNSAYVTSACYQSCSSLSPEESASRAEDDKEHFTVRLYPPKDVKKRTYPDLVYGRINRLERSTAIPQSDVEDDIATYAADTILLKSDGTPTYHFANVVDDHLMEITHVIRGSEWMASTPLHYDIYHAFGWTAPQFAHVGLLVDENKAKLSKRNADLALDVRSMRDEQGVLPSTLNNFLALLGWSNPTGNDTMDMAELANNFDLKFTKGNTMVRMEKLWYLQKQHVARLCSESKRTNSQDPVSDILQQVVKEVLEQHPNFHLNNFPDQLSAYCHAVLLADSKSYHNAAQYIQRNRWLFTFDPGQVPKPQQSYNKSRTLTLEKIERFVKGLMADFDWRGAYGLSSPGGSAIKDIIPIGQRISDLDTRIHTAISYNVWIMLFEDATSYDDPPEPLRSTSDRREDLKQVLFTAQSDSIEETARTISGGLSASSSDGEVTILVRRYKILNGAVMKYLREKLSYGLPGPSMSVAMAILGYEECCRRLGVTPREDSGWDGAETE